MKLIHHASFLIFVFSVFVALSTTAGSAQTTTVTPTVETDSFSGSGDIADDSVIWLNPANPAQSVVIADNKDNSGGIAVFDLAGKQLQFRADGAIGNVDLHSFSFNGQPITLIGANNRSNDTISLYKLNPTTRQLEPIPGTRPTLKPNYGFCFYQSKQSGKLYATCQCPSINCSGEFTSTAGVLYCT